MTLPLPDHTSLYAGLKSATYRYERQSLRKFILDTNRRRNRCLRDVYRDIESFLMLSLLIVSPAKTLAAPMARHMDRTTVVNFFMVKLLDAWGVDGGIAGVASAATEPVVALVFPVAAAVGVADENRLDVLGILVAELGGHAQFHREAVFAR